MIADASALIALLTGEPGAAVVADKRLHLSVSSVNYCETLQYLMRIGRSAERAMQMVGDLQVPVVAASPAHAAQAARLQGVTRPHGLSLGDRFCLALALERGEAVLTADRVWADLAIAGLKVHLIR